MPGFVEGERCMETTSASLAAIMTTTLDAIVATDEHGIVIGWNHNAEVIFGHSAEEALQRPMDEIIIPVQTRSAHNHGMHRYLMTGVVHILGKRVGLGLSICRAIVEQRGANIWVQSDGSGKSVTFTVAAG